MSAGARGPPRTCGRRGHLGAGRSDVVVDVADGVYRLARTFTLDPSISGPAGHATIFRAVAGKPATASSEWDADYRASNANDAIPVDYTPEVPSTDEIMHRVYAALLDRMQSPRFAIAHLDRYASKP